MVSPPPFFLQFREISGSKKIFAGLCCALFRFVPTPPPYSPGRDPAEGETTARLTVVNF